MAIYEVCVEARFEAAHHLTSYRGRPEPVHGHSWRVQAMIETETLGEEGMAFDFVVLKERLNALADRFRHRDINTVPPFDRRTPTTEHLAAWFFDQLASDLGGCRLAAVTVWEGPDCCATYRPRGERS